MNTKEKTAFYAKKPFEETTEVLNTNKFWIAGGVLRSYVENIKLVDFNESKIPIFSKDIDCFFEDDKALHTAKDSLIRQGYKLGKERANSLSTDKEGHTSYDLVYLNYVFSGKSIIEDFDFTNCCISYGKEGLVTNEFFFQDVENKLLRINKVKIPYHTIQRAGKFIKKGYNITDLDKIILFDNAANAIFGPYEEDEYKAATVAPISDSIDLTLSS